MTIKRKEQKIHNIAKVYLSLFLRRSAVFGIFHNSHLSSFQTSVEFAYSSLSAPLKRIINNDFFYQDYPGWWKLIYKKNDYQRLRKQAVTSFLEVFYAI